MAPPRIGHGLATEVSLEIPPGTVDYWGARLQSYSARIEGTETRFGARALTLTDPHGMRVALVEGVEGSTRAFAPWNGSSVPSNRQIRGLYGAQVWERDAAATEAFLTNVLGFVRVGEENGWTRYGFPDAAGVIDVREARDARRGAWGVGAIHHLAWRVDDEMHQFAVRQQVESAGSHPTPVIDRFWFKSVYFKEPGGVLFELATDGPGFAVDEDPAHLGESLVLPPWLEPSRARIEAVLPGLTQPVASL
jgi:glyoxalase family protein